MATATTIATMSPVPRPGGLRAGPPPSAAAQSLLRQAESGLREAELALDASRRFAAAHLAALWAGAAVLAERARPSGRPSGRSVWQLLASVAPELGEWAAFFAAGSATRAAAEAGNTRLVTDRAADDLVRQAGQFLEVSRSLVCPR
ncbi:MAG: hypothetical protein H0V92_08200 [Pseudonocardiales bacterium]|nr:hypothetical protein [Pseudonocardiales bacterium]